MPPAVAARRGVESLSVEDAFDATFRALAFADAELNIASTQVTLPALVAAGEPERAASGAAKAALRAHWSRSYARGEDQTGRDGFRGRWRRVDLRVLTKICMSLVSMCVSREAVVAA